MPSRAARPTGATPERNPPRIGTGPNSRMGTADWGQVRSPGSSTSSQEQHLQRAPAQGQVSMGTGLKVSTSTVTGRHVSRTGTGRHVWDGGGAEKMESGGQVRSGQGQVRKKWTRDLPRDRAVLPHPFERLSGTKSVLWVAPTSAAPLRQGGRSADAALFQSKMAVPHRGRSAVRSNARLKR